jgi:putative oxidoreductase
MRFLRPAAPYFQSLLRIVAGLLFLEHGTAKLLHFPHTAMADHITLMSMMGAAGIIELVGGALITAGLLTRFAAFIAAGEMAVAYWMVHVPMGGLLPLLNNGGEAILFCFVFLFLSAAGAGPVSVDAALGGGD